MTTAPKKPTNPRRLATETLIRVDKEGAYSNIALDAALRAAQLTGRDAAFATALFYLTLERRVTIRHCIGAFCPHKLSVVVGAILETAVAQLLYMEQVPQSAAVNEAVALTRAMGQARSAGLVNGVLRSFIRAGCKIPPAEGSPSVRMSVDCSCDERLCKKLIEWYDERTAREILMASLGRAPVFLRVNTHKCSREQLMEALASQGIMTREGPLEDCLTLTSGDPTATSAYRGGLFHVQDIASQRAVHVLDPKPGERILDVCAAPGGKSFTIAQIMGDSGEILSCDIHEGRLGLIRDGARRMGLKSIRTAVNDGTVHNPALGLFDRILCDAPCSGLGVMRRKPELKYRDPAAFAGLPEIQYKILLSSSHYLMSGGRLLYTTCTVNPLENKGVVERFLKENPAFMPVYWCDEGFMKTFLPTEAMGGDGFFIAAMTKGSDL